MKRFVKLTLLGMKKVKLRQQCICPVCFRLWGVSWPPISVCPPCHTEAVNRKLPKRLPAFRARAWHATEQKRWTDAGWDLSPLYEILGR